MRTVDFDYDLPEDLIAQEPSPKRDESRLLVLDRQSGRMTDTLFKHLPEYLRSGDCLILNDARVIPARLRGVKEGTGGRVEVLLLRPLQSGAWECLVKPGRRIGIGQRLLLGGGEIAAEVLDRTEDGGRVISFRCDGDFYRALERAGEVPLPPYIHRKLEDPERYQTVYAEKPGSVAAPTAGLHFTPDLLQEIRDLGVSIGYITLNVGLGTFRPVQTERIEEHRLHAESYTIPDATAELIRSTREGGGRVVAVGTTVCRTLEDAARDGEIRSLSRTTDLFIYPGFRFRAIDALVTNFHLPRSTLLMLVSAFAGRELVLEAYRHAVRERYRFFSFGDAMFIT